MKGLNRSTEWDILRAALAATLLFPNLLACMLAATSCSEQQREGPTGAWDSTTVAVRWQCHPKSSRDMCTCSV